MTWKWDSFRSGYHGGYLVDNFFCTVIVAFRVQIFITHHQHWQSNPNPFDLKSNAKSTRPHALTMSVHVSKLWNNLFQSKCNNTMIRYFPNNAMLYLGWIYFLIIVHIRAIKCHQVQGNKPKWNSSTMYWSNKEDKMLYECESGTYEALYIQRLGHKQSFKVITYFQVWRFHQGFKTFHLTNRSCCNSRKALRESKPPLRQPPYGTWWVIRALWHTSWGTRRCTGKQKTLQPHSTQAFHHIHLWNPLSSCPCFSTALLPPFPSPPSCCSLPISPFSLPPPPNRWPLLV